MGGDIDWSLIGYDEGMTGVPGITIPEYVGGMDGSSDISFFTNTTTMGYDELVRLIGKLNVGKLGNQGATIVYDDMNDKAYLDLQGLVTLEAIRNGDSMMMDKEGVREIAKPSPTSRWCTCTRCVWARDQRLGCSW